MGRRPAGGPQRAVRLRHRALQVLRLRRPRLGLHRVRLLDLAGGRRPDRRHSQRHRHRPRPVPGQRRPHHLLDRLVRPRPHAPRHHRLLRAARGRRRRGPRLRAALHAARRAPLRGRPRPRPRRLGRGHPRLGRGRPGPRAPGGDEAGRGRRGHDDSPRLPVPAGRGLRRQREPQRRGQLRLRDPVAVRSLRRRNGGLPEGWLGARRRPRCDLAVAFGDDARAVARRGAARRREFQSRPAWSRIQAVNSGSDERSTPRCACRRCPAAAVGAAPPARGRPSAPKLPQVGGEGAAKGLAEEAAVPPSARARAVARWIAVSDNQELAKPSSTAMRSLHLPQGRRRREIAVAQQRLDEEAEEVRTVTGITLPRAAHGNRGRAGRS